MNIEAPANGYQRHICKLGDSLRIFKIYFHQGVSFRKTGARFGNGDLFLRKLTHAETGFVSPS